MLPATCIAGGMRMTGRTRPVSGSSERRAGACHIGGARVACPAVGTSVGTSVRQMRCEVHPPGPGVVVEPGGHSPRELRGGRVLVRRQTAQLQGDSLRERAHR